jgi:hypothetical protein
VSYLTRGLPLLQLTFPAFAVILAAGWPFFPESPYWLVRNGKMDQARKALRRVYGFKDTEFYDIEVRRLQEEIAFSREVQGSLETKQEGTFFGIDLSAEMDCFHGTNRKRTGLPSLLRAHSR